MFRAGPDLEEFGIKDHPSTAGEQSVWASPANRITVLRLASLPLLWILALLGEPEWLGIGVALAAFTDVIDGFLARRFGQTTVFGSRLDSMADHVLTTSTLVWLIWFRSDFFSRERVPLTIWAVLGAVTLLVGWVKFRRIGGPHLYSAKAAGALGYLFAILLLVSGNYSRWLFGVVIGFAFVALLETLVVLLISTRLEGDVKSVLFLRVRKP